MVDAGRGALGHLPARGALVERADVELVDHEDAPGPHELGEPGARLGERVDVVQRHDGDGGVEGRRCAGRLEQRDGLDPGRAVGGRVDRHDVVAGVAEGPGQLAAARADLEHARRRGRQGAADEGEDARVDGHQRTAPPAARTSSSARSTSPGCASMPREPAVSSVTPKPSRSASSAVARTQ